MGLNSRTKSMAASVYALAKISKKSSNGLHITITSDQQPLHGVAKTWSRCRSRALMCSTTGYIHIKVDQWLLCRSRRGKTFLVAQPMQLVAHTRRGMVVGSVQTVAAIANDESLQVRVRKAHPAEGRSSRHPLAHRGAKTGCLLTSRSAAS